MEPFTAEEADLLKKQINTSRYLLFIVAAEWLISASLISFHPSYTGKLVDLLITGLLAVVYCCLGAWTREKPYTAIRVGLAIDVLFILVSMIPDPSGIFNHWPSKLLSIGLLWLGIGDSKDAQKKMSALHNEHPAQ